MKLMFASDIHGSAYWAKKVSKKDLRTSMSIYIEEKKETGKI